MTYSGAFRDRYYVEPGRVIYQSDPAHAVTDAPDPNAYTWEAPPMPENAAPEYLGMDMFATLPGVVLDNTPVTHDGSPHPSRDTDAEMQADSRAAHSRDYGASRADNFALPPVEFHDERQTHTVVQGYGSEASAVNPVALLRGLNANPENNPDGFRQGETSLWRFDRKFPVGERRHDTRVVSLNTAYAAGNVPPPPADRFTPYSSPFASLARAITNVAQRPAVRRDPVGLSEGIQTDGNAEYSDPIGADWVM